MNSARAIVLQHYPEARVVRGVFGLVVITNPGDFPKTLGEGRAYYEEEAWLSALEAIDQPQKEVTHE